MSKASESKMEAELKAFEIPYEDDFFSGCPIPGAVRYSTGQCLVSKRTMYARQLMREERP